MAYWLELYEFPHLHEAWLLNRLPFPHPNIRIYGTLAGTTFLTPTWAMV